MSRPPPQRNFYEVLGVSRNAGADEIDLAYERLKEDAKKDSTPPDPQGLAMAKVARDTLTNPAMRAEYDRRLAAVPKPAPVKKKAKPLPAAAIGGAAVLAIALVAAGWYFTRSGGGAPTAAKASEPLTPAKVADEVGPKVGAVHAALMSGEVRDIGLAVIVGNEEMATTCRGMVPGAQLSVKMRDATWKAELARANEKLDICTLRVKDIPSGVKLRANVPPASERLQAVTLGAKPAIFSVSTPRALPSPEGPAMEVKSPTPLANGTPIFDSQARLVGLVVTPHAFGEGVVAALGAARLTQAGSAPAAAASEPAKASGSAPAPSASAMPGTSGVRGKMVAEGFTTLWREDERTLQLSEVLDDVKKGQVGVPHAYWTKWTGRDTSRPHVVHCVVTQGPDDAIVADYDQDTMEFPADGYWFCAITRFQVDLDKLPVGEYTFTIFVDGKQAAQNSLRIEKRFFTRGVWAGIVFFVGLGLLAFLRRNRKVVSYAS